MNKYWILHLSPAMSLTWHWPICTTNSKMDYFVSSRIEAPGSFETVRIPFIRLVQSVPISSRRVTVFGIRKKTAWKNVPLYGSEGASLIRLLILSLHFRNHKSQSFSPHSIERAGETGSNIAGMHKNRSLHIMYKSSNFTYDTNSSSESRLRTTFT